MLLRRSIFLVAAFAALFAISGGAAWAIWTNTQSAQANAARLHQSDMAIRNALGEIRSNVYLTAILARDLLLEEAPNEADYTQQFQVIQDQTRKSLRTLEDQVSGKEMEAAIGQLTGELMAYAASNVALQASIAGHTQQERQGALRLRVGRRRDILTLTERIETLAADSSSAQRTLSAAGDSTFRSSLGWIAGVALLLGAGVAGFSLLRILTLEQQSEDAEAKLRSLSGQLRTTQEQERRHLSRELHDQVGQMLTGLRMELAAISRSDAASVPEVRAALARAKDTTEQTLNIVRNIAMLLRPSMLDDLGLTPALTWLARSMERSSGMEIRRDIDSHVDQLPDAHRTCLYRVVQEALTNAARHSGGRSVDLRVTWAAGVVRVRVTDDGRGFYPAVDKGKGLGLLGIEERARELGGHLHISSVPGGGAALEIVLPAPASFTTGEAHAENNGDDRGRPRDREDRVTTAI